VSFFSFSHIIKYYSFGILVNIVCYLLFIEFIKYGYDHKLVASLLYIIASLASFILNRKHVFDSSLPLFSSLARLVAMLVTGYILNISMLYFFVDIYRIDSRIVQAFSVIIASIYFYFFNKLIVHKSKPV
jgi:putative flippase GtrA